LKTGEILATYGKYYDSLQKLGAFPLSRSPELGELNLSKAILQAAYREIRGSDFQGSLVDYLCFVSTWYMAWSSKANNASELAVFLRDKFPEFEADARNLLRLLLRNPNYLFTILGEVPDKAAFTELAGMWFDLYQGNGME
jgi:hypothetical protein